MGVGQIGQEKGDDIPGSDSQIMEQIRRFGDIGHQIAIVYLHRLVITVARKEKADGRGRRVDGGTFFKQVVSIENIQAVFKRYFFKCFNVTDIAKFHFSHNQAPHFDCGF